MFGEDPRLFVMSDDRVFVIICHRFLRMKPELQVSNTKKRVIWVDMNKGSNNLIAHHCPASHRPDPSFY